MNPEIILGHLLQSGLRTSRRERVGVGFGTKARLGMGALGLAIAAFEHFSQQSKTSSSSATPPIPPRASRAVPPPIPSAEPPAEQASTSLSITHDHADTELLIRAMIAAANADRLIDRDEEQRILEAGAENQLTQEDLEYLESEINRPRTMFEIVAGATTRELARQVYTASLLAVSVDTEAERRYLRELASSLHLSPADVEEIESEVGV